MNSLIRRTMKKHFGYEGFRPGQEKVIQSIMDCRDTLGIMPTGGGKSLCYQLPAMMSPGITLVISPLIALMKDQVDALNQQGVAASYINSSLAAGEVRERIQQAAQGRFKLLYVAPERLESQQFRALLERIPVALLAVDEAHCVSQWGHDFRPSYLSIGPWIDSLTQRPTLAAFTATATARVREDIITSLGLATPQIFINSFDRPNLRWMLAKGVDRESFIARYLKEHPDEPGIVYAATRKEVDHLREYLASRGFKAGKYHAGMTNVQRTSSQEDFAHDRVQVIVATNAFGLGIDKSNVRFVIHNNMPRNLESYYQEGGRAGRDGQAADCILLFHAGDVHLQKFLIEQGTLARDKKQMEHLKLRDMIDYCHTSRCLRAYILEYFGEPDVPANCGNCGNCNDYEVRDVTLEAQKIFSCIYRMRQQYGGSLVAAVLKGSRQKRIMELGLDELSTYGIMQGNRLEDIVEYINILAAEGYLEIEAGQYPVVRLSPSATPVLRGQARVLVRMPQARAAGQENTLFQSLRALRLEIARQSSIPPYMVFADSTLREMSNRLPLDREGMLGITGVGEVKFARYGQPFLALISDYVREPVPGRSIAEDKEAFPDEEAAKPESPTAAERRPRQSKEKTPSYIISWDRYQNGMTLEEIAQERGIGLRSVQEHMIRAVVEGMEVKWEEFVTPEQEAAIVEAARDIGARKLRLIKEALPEDIDYFAIQIALARDGLTQIAEVVERGE